MQVKMNSEPLGLTTKEAQKRLMKYGPNAIQEFKKHPVFEFLAKFWSPIPWMLEITFILQLSLGKKNESIVTICLLVFNAVVGFIQEKRAQSALSLLRKKLQIKARVLRDKAWILMDAQEIVKDDVIRIRMGDFIPADIKLLEGNILVDRSALTGESFPIELTTDNKAFSGSIIKRGEATGLVIATGKRSFFGKTAELVRSAKSESHFEKTVLNIVEYLVSIDIVLVVIILIYSAIADIPLSAILPFSLVLLIASVPVALPATFTLMSALASLKLANSGVLVTRLTAIEEAAAMEILCCDKTGTLTQNSLILKDIKPLLPITTTELLRLAAFASNEASQDPFDTAILSLARNEGVLDLKNRLEFIPFDSLTKRSEAIVKDQNKVIRIVKGAPPLIASMTSAGVDVMNVASQLAAQGDRILSIAFGEGEQLQLAGFLIFSDPIREESRKTIEDLKKLGLTIKMFTGDVGATAKAIAAEIGMGQRIGPKEAILSKHIQKYDIFAEVFPEDKYQLVQTLQQEGCVVGMTGDGVNDAPALRQADVGIAVSNATDVAKAASSMILTNPGLGNLIEAIKTGREVYRRMLTYTLNKIVKTTDIALFLSLGLLFEDVFVITPRLVMFLIFANDFVTMSLASDNVKIADSPCSLKVRFLAPISLLLALCWLSFYFAVFFAARDFIKLPLPATQTLMFLMFVFSGLATVYLVRTRDHFWKIRPGKFLLISTIADILSVSSLAYFGILMEPLSLELILFLASSVVAFMILLDQIKALVFQRFVVTKGLA